MKHSMPKPRHTPCKFEDISAIQFSAFSQSQIVNYSVLEIDQPQFYEKSLPVKNGLFDLRLGISDPKQKCETCGESIQCPGHFGHIKLKQPVMHCGFVDVVQKVLKCVCHQCYRLKRCQNQEGKAMMKEIRRVVEPEKRLNLMVKLLENVKKCSKSSGDEDLFDKNYKPCGHQIPTKLTLKNTKIHYQNPITSKSTEMSLHQIQKILQNFSLNTLQCQALGFTKTLPIDLILRVLIVPPPQIRPYVLINYQNKCQDDLSVQYMKIIRINNQLKQVKRRKGVCQREELVREMEDLIGRLMVKMRNVNKKETKINKKEKNKNIKSISQRLKGKQGRFRQNLLGKRVDFSARTVISPDPNLNLYQIGIPQKISKNLTIPQKVTALNIDRISQLCSQQKIKYLLTSPESSLQNKQTILNVQKIPALTPEQYKKYLTYGMIAQRCLENGDYLLVNRQPSLHRMSMMAHKVRILGGNTFRINLAVCGPYNADFDGDQMNVHVPQSEQTIAQLKNITHVQNQIVSPKNGTVAMGFSQDSLLGAHLLSSRDTFLNRQEITNLLMGISFAQQSQLTSFIQDLPLPCIIKPQPLWSGKQLLSLILPKSLSLPSNPKSVLKPNQNYLTQSTLLIKNGQIIIGNLQKQHIGTASAINNIIHYLWVEYTAEQATRMINNLQKIVYNWLSGFGFSLGLQDVVPVKQLIPSKKNEIDQVNKIYYDSLNQFRDRNKIKQNHLHQQGKLILQSFQYLLNSKLNNNLSKIQQLVKNAQKTTHNNIYKIIQSKSKGSQTNLAQIVYSVGNQNVNGERCPLGFNRRCLPHFAKDDHSPTARGYVDSSFYQGLRAEQLFYHAMGGRQGLSDTAVKTSHVGYIQRKLVKSLQDLIVRYDGSVRDASGNMIQKLYGQDGFCAQFIQKHKCQAANMNAKKFRQIYKWKKDQLKRMFRYNNKQLQKMKQQYSNLYKSKKIFMQFTSALELSSSYAQSQSNQYYCPIAIQKIIAKIKSTATTTTTGTTMDKIVEPLQIYEKVQQLLKQCLLPTEKYLTFIRDNKDKNKDQFNQRQKAGKKDDGYQSFSDQFQRQDQDFNKKIEDRYTKCNKIVTHTSQYDIFKIHLRFSLSSRVLHKNHSLTKSNFLTLISLIKQKFFKSLSLAGQSVGCIASQSIGQPTTQMTLNTFHLAGISDRNVTLGLPRLQQLLNCSNGAGTQLVNNLTIYPKRPIAQSESNKADNQNYLLNLLFHSLPQRKIDDFIHTIRYSCRIKNKKQDEKSQIVQQNQQNINHRGKWIIQIEFNYQKIYSKTFWQEIVDKIERNAAKQYKIMETVDFNDISNKSTNPKIFLGYLAAPGAEEQHLFVKLAKTKMSTKLISNLQKIEQKIRNIQICGIKGIKSVKLSKKLMNLSQSDQLSVQQNNKNYIVFQATVHGNCLKNILKNQQINGYRTYSNNIKQISQTLGIEAARQSLINQFKQVLKPYGILINYRHLSVLVDWMCYRGQLTSVNRNGLNQVKNLPVLTKASFQMATGHLFKAAVFGNKDQIKDTSQKIIFGQQSSCGTSQCQLMVDPEKCVNYVCRLPELDPKIALASNNSQNILSTPQYDYPGAFLLHSNPNQSNYKPTNTNLNRSFNNQLSPNNTSFHKSPVTHPNNYMSFSPSYSPHHTDTFTKIQFSPKYNGGKVNTDCTTVGRYSSPSYSNHQYSYGHNQRSPISPSYSTYKLASSSSNKYQQYENSVTGKGQKKEEQLEEGVCDNQEETQRTHAIVQHKDQDQF